MTPENQRNSIDPTGRYKGNNYDPNYARKKYGVGAQRRDDRPGGGRERDFGRGGGPSSYSDGYAASAEYSPREYMPPQQYRGQDYRDYRDSSTAYSGSPYPTSNPASTPGWPVPPFTPGMFEAAQDTPQSAYTSTSSGLPARPAPSTPNYTSRPGTPSIPGMARDVGSRHEQSPRHWSAPTSHAPPPVPFSEAPAQAPMPGLSTASIPSSSGIDATEVSTALQASEPAAGTPATAGEIGSLEKLKRFKAQVEASRLARAQSQPTENIARVAETFLQNVQNVASSSTEASTMPAKTQPLGGGAGAPRERTPPPAEEAEDGEITETPETRQQALREQLRRKLKERNSTAIGSGSPGPASPGAGSQAASGGQSKPGPPALMAVEQGPSESAPQQAAAQPQQAEQQQQQSPDDEPDSPILSTQGWSKYLEDRLRAEPQPQALPPPQSQPQPQPQSQPQSQPQPQPQPQSQAQPGRQMRTDIPDEPIIGREPEVQHSRFRDAARERFEARARAVAAQSQSQRRSLSPPRLSAAQRQPIPTPTPEIRRPSPPREQYQEKERAVPRAREAEAPRPREPYSGRRLSLPGRSESFAERRDLVAERREPLERREHVSERRAPVDRYAEHPPQPSSARASVPRDYHEHVETPTHYAVPAPREAVITPTTAWIVKTLQLLKEQILELEKLIDPAALAAVNAASAVRQPPQPSTAPPPLPPPPRTSDSYSQDRNYSYNTAASSESRQAATRPPSEYEYSERREYEERDRYKPQINKPGYNAYRGDYYERDRDYAPSSGGSSGRGRGRGGYRGRGGRTHSSSMERGPSYDGKQAGGNSYTSANNAAGTSNANASGGFEYRASERHGSSSRDW